MDELVKCSRCSFKGPQEDFPRRNGSLHEYLKTCRNCADKANAAARKKRNKENDDNDTPLPKRQRGLGKDTSKEGPPTLTLASVIDLLTENKNSSFELHAYVALDDSCMGLSGPQLSGHLARKVWDATDYRFNYKKKTPSKTSSTLMKYSYYCAQNEAEQSKPKLNENPSKRRARMCMQRFKCDGWLHVSVDENDSSQVIMRITHYENHIPYTDISVSEKVEELIGSLVDLPATKIWDIVLEKKLEGQLTQKQVYAHWAQHNENRWRLDNDQVLSARKVLEACEGIEVNVIDVPHEKGISSLAFAFREVLSVYGSKITEIAMDSTWKTNAAGYELYGIVGEANGQALPLAFAFTASMDHTAEPGAKDRMIQSVLRHVREHCPNIHFAHTDKDKSEINAIHAVLPYAKSQLCYWHAIKYLCECLAEDKLPTKYDPRRAHQLFSFIDPTWAPGVAAPGIEDGVHEDDVDLDKNTNIPDPTPLPSTQPLPSTCRPPVLVLVSSD
ncbi:hypothetical protein DXG01_017130, partial [Tephrocybe rancida]